MAELRNSGIAGARVAADPLIGAAAAYLAANLLHTADHLRQGLGDVSTAVLVGGTALTIGAVLVLWLSVRGDSRTPVAAMWVGGAAALGVIASHLLPSWGTLSYSYPDKGVDALSWIVVLLEISAAAYLAVVGFRARRDA
jgi:hypothetical protein